MSERQSTSRRSWLSSVACCLRASPHHPLSPAKASSAAPEPPEAPWSGAAASQVLQVIAALICIPAMARTLPRVQAWLRNGPHKHCAQASDAELAACCRQAPLAIRRQRRASAMWRWPSTPLPPGARSCWWCTAASARTSTRSGACRPQARVQTLSAGILNQHDTASWGRSEAGRAGDRQRSANSDHRLIWTTSYYFRTTSY